MRLTAIVSAIAVSLAPLGVSAQPVRYIRGTVSVAQFFGDRVAAARARANVRAMVPSIAEDLRLTGEAGFLVEVPVYTNADGRILSQAPVSCGSGANPADALLNCYERRAMPVTPQVGWIYSSRLSHVLWFERGQAGPESAGSGTRYGIIPQDALAEVRAQVIATVSDRNLYNARTEERRMRVLGFLVERAARQVRDAETRALLNADMERLQRNRAAISQADAELTAALDREARANNLSQQISMLQGVIALGQSVGELYDRMGAERGSDSHLRLENTAAAIEWLGSYSSRMGQEASALRSRTETLRASSLQTEASIERTLINDLGIPRTVLP
jgi:hypothetical protein